MSVHDVFALVDRDIVLSDEDNCVGAVANAGDALGKATMFDHVGLAPEFLYLGLMRRWHISMRVPVSVLRMALRISQGNFRQDACFAVNGRPVMSLGTWMHARMDS